MTEAKQPEASSTHIIRFALELGLLWIDGSARDKVREALDALDTLEAQLEAIGAGGVSALMGAAKAGSEPVATVFTMEALTPGGGVKYHATIHKPLPAGTKLYAAPQPALSAGWVSVDERLPEPNIEVLCAGRGWGNSFVTACYYDDERREWYLINTDWTDATGCAQYPTHWQPLPPSPSMDGESNG